MSKLRYIRDSFWTDSYVEKLSPDEKLIFLYLLTNPLCNVAGIYEIRSKRIGFETGYDTEVIENILCRFVHDGKLLRDGDLLALVNHLKNQAVNPSIIKGVERIVNELPVRFKDVVTGWVQAGLLNLTLLNLTKPNVENDTTDIPALSKKNTTEIKEKFETLRKLYQVKLKGKCRGFETEFKNADKKHNLTVELIEEMNQGAKRMYQQLQKAMEIWEAEKGKQKDKPTNFVPRFATFINNNRWEE